MVDFHNEGTVASELKLLLLEVNGQPADGEFLRDAIFHGLNSHYELDEHMRLDGWISNDNAFLSLVWKDLRSDCMTSDSDT